MNHTIIGLGEALWDVLPEGKKLGGAPANFAFHASQFGNHGIAVSALGNDALGDEAIAEFEAKNLDVIMPRLDFPTGTVPTSLDENGVPTYEIKEGVAWDNIPLTEEMEEAARKADAVCFGSLAQRSEKSRNTIMRFLELTPATCLKIFDINLRQNFYTKEIIVNSLRHCDVLKINDEELVVVSRLFEYPGLSTEDKCRRILNKYNLKMLVLTCGVNGSYVFTPNEMSFYATPRVQVADTVGAGDSFTGTFCASILDGMTVTDAHKRAVEVSAYVCTQNGAMPELPEEVKNMK